MTDEVFAALERGATLATSTPRLARSFAHEFGARQLAFGRHAWPTPAILPWSAFIRRLWENSAGEGSAPVLTAVQEQALWEAIVEESPEWANLIQPHAAARLAGEAWRLIQEWRIPLAGRKHSAAVWDATAETSTFLGWAQQFQFHTRWLDRLDAARVVESLTAAASITGPAELYLAGFDEWTPRQGELIASLEKSGTAVTRLAAAVGHDATASLAAFPDRGTEIDACAEWCRARLAANPAARIGVVAMELEEHRHKWERAFRLAVPGAFHLALGPPLATRPMAAAALTLLEFGGERVSWDAVSALLLSPWVGGFADERGRRAGCEIALRRARAAEFATAGLARHRACPPLLSRQLWTVETLRRGWPDEQKPGAWSRAFSAVLDAFGWPGSEQVDSAEYQTLEAWRTTLSELASTDAIQPAIGRVSALAWLRRVAAEKRFEIESTGEPIQIMGPGESAGARFDHLWVAGMNDETWPERPRANPFVPLGLQRQFDLPHSSPARELEAANRLSRRLLGAADDVVVSFAKTDAERELTPSPLFAALPAWRPPERAVTAPRAPDSSVDLEAIDDAEAPAIPEDAVAAGGTRALEMQAKCPFRAFAEMRLGARDLDAPEPGLDPRARGGFVHAALEHFWQRLPGSAALRAASPDEVRAAVADSVDQALAAHEADDDALTRKLLALERIRLIELIESWIELERGREVEFTVEAPEQERTVQLGGLTVQVRLDRLDRLANGSYALIDYKSRAPKLGDWDGERPESPQLPIYAVTASEPLAAIAFAQVRTGENQYKGYSTLDGVLPGLRVSDPAELQERIAEWRRVLDSLGQEFRAGRADVDPKERFKTCEHCHLAALCRVEEKQ